MIIKPPQACFMPTPKSVFLGGSIEMGSAIDWQNHAGSILDGPDVTIYNPRRDNWDSSWKQSIDNPHFAAQVNWELDMLERAKLKFFYFHPATKAPITLMELGIAGAMYSAKNPTFRTEEIIVCCPDGYWRKGNVEVVCRRFGIAKLVNDYAEALDMAMLWLKS